MSGDILFVSSTGQVSGAEKVMLNMITYALKSGSSVSVACPDGPLANALPSGAEHLSIPELSLGGRRGAARLVAVAKLAVRWYRAARVLRQRTQTPGTDTVVNSVLALPAARWAKPPRGVGWLVHDATTNSLQRIVIRVGRPAIRIAVGCSHSAAAPLRDLGLPVTAVVNGVPWPVPSSFGPVHEPPVVGMLALLTPWKGHRVVLEALAQLPGVTAEFAGGHFPTDDVYVHELTTRAHEADLDGRVTFLGQVDPVSAMARWDVLISASTSPEAGPLNVLEAMSHGLPVIATDHGGSREFLRDGVGLMVPPDDPAALRDAIASLLADGNARAEMSEAGRRRIAAEHDINVTLPTLLDTLRGRP